MRRILGGIAAAALITAAAAAAAGVPTRSASLHITALDYAFQAPDTVPAGWTTLTLHNAGEEPHFMLLNRLPEGRTLADYGAAVGPPFDRAMAALRAGRDRGEVAAELGAALPPWYLQGVKQMGGVGMLASGATASATLELEPGTYVMECYVKAPDGRFHSALGMVRTLVVVPSEEQGTAPAADLRVAVANGSMHADSVVQPGRHVVAVDFREHPAAGLGNDVHVVRLAPDDDLGEVTQWMDWMNVGGLRSPAPADFVGGIQELPAGRTGYFTVVLSPGRYAFMSEATAAQGAIREVVVR